MPQLNPLDWAPQLIWLVITFGILYLLMKRVALPKIGSVIEMRQGRIAGDLEAADKLRRETQEAIAAYEQALAEAKARAHGIAQEARNRLKDEVAAERAALERDLSAKSAEAEARIHQAKVSALEGSECGRLRNGDRNRAAADRHCSDASRRSRPRSLRRARSDHGIHHRAGILGRRIVLHLLSAWSSISACTRRSRPRSMPAPR